VIEPAPGVLDGLERTSSSVARASSPRSLSDQNTSHEVMTVDNVTLLAVSSSVRFNVGYTAMW